MRKALTLIELAITLIMFSILAGVLVNIFRVVSLSWSSQVGRAGIYTGLDRAIEEMARDLREARQLQCSGDEIRFTQDENSYYIYYLFNAGDTYPPNFNRDLYELRKAALSGGISGSFSYGSGQIILSEVSPPPASDLSLSASIVTLDLSVIRGDETVRSPTKISPRNL